MAADLLRSDVSIFCISTSHYFLQSSLPTVSRRTHMDNSTAYLGTSNDQPKNIKMTSRVGAFPRAGTHSPRLPLSRALADYAEAAHHPFPISFGELHFFT
jgi:hypothetical protein